MRFRACLLAISLIATGPLAAEPTQVPSSKSRPSADPNQKVCEDETVVGSRLAVKRICATRSEWAQKRRDDRDTVDQIQRGPCVIDPSGQCQH